MQKHALIIGGIILGVIAIVACYVLYHKHVTGLLTSPGVTPPPPPPALPTINFTDGGSTTAIVKVGSQWQLIPYAPGGTWQGGSPYATVNGTGILTAQQAGPATIYYVLNGGLPTGRMQINIVN